MSINASTLIKSEDNPTGLISKSLYDALVIRNGIDVVRRGHYSTPALVAFDSLRIDIKEWVISTYGDPYKVEKEEKAQTQATIKELGYIIEIDENAKKFYATHIHNYEGIDAEFQPKYTNTASVLNAFIAKYNDRVSTIKRCNGSCKNVLSEEVAWYNSHRQSLEQKYPHSLPKNERRFIEKLREYQKKGYITLISEKINNQNSNKIKGPSAEWLIGQWANPVSRHTIMQLWEAYNIKALEQKWPEIKSHATLLTFLNRPEVKVLWIGARQGELIAKEIYTRQHRTILPTMRDSVWYSDGTKLNYYYLNEDGKVSTCMVYEVMDAFSETFLGYHISKSEDFEAQYMAYKMAIKYAGHKPYEAKYDNQSGHKKLQNSDFLGKLAHISTFTAPYNGSSKTIESAFGRFQKQFLHKDWYFTGQNITAKMQESKSNIDFILANKNSLPTLEEVKATYLKRRNEWNNAKHYSSGKSHIAMYEESFNPQSPKIDTWDMIELFWMTTKDASTYRASGIEIQVKNEKYAFEVLNADGNPDEKFLQNNAGNKFFVKYDPDDMTLVSLHRKTSNGLRYVASASSYLKIHRGKQEQQEGESVLTKYMELVNKAARVSMQENSESLMERQGVHPSQSGLVMPNIKGVNSSRRAKKQKGDGYGSYVKKLSNVVAGVDDDDEEIDQFKLY